MALHEIIQVKKVSILGNEITTKRTFLKHTPTTIHSYVPESGVISQASGFSNMIMCILIWDQHYML